MTRIASPLVSCVLAAALLLRAAPAPAEKPGTFRELVSRRVPVAAVARGQAFAVALNGTSVLAGPFALEVPGGKGPLTLILETPVFEAGRFSSPVRLKNGSGIPLSGLRLDVTGATAVETEAPTAPARELRLSLPSPLWFGELSPGQESAPVLLEVDVDVPQGTKGPVIVMGVVSGASVVEDPEAAAEADRAFRALQKQRPACTAEMLDPVRGEGFGQAAQPIGCLTSADGTLWVVDLSGDPLKLYDSRSGFLRSLGPTAGPGAAYVAFGSGGRVYVYEAGERQGTAILLRTLRPF